MTEALNRHLPERPRLRVPLNPRRAAARPGCRSALAAKFKPSTLPFEALKAMSENPAWLRRFWSLWPMLLLALGPGAAHAAETNQPPPAVPAAPAAEAKPAAAVTAPAPASTNVAVVPSAAPASSSPDSGRRDRDRNPSSSAATDAPPGSFESFRLIAERNIFDPNRSPRAPRSSGGEEPRRVPKIEAFALAGTMSFSNRHLAFFTSASSQYQKALKPGDAIAGYQIATVAPDHVKLEKDGAAVELKLNQQLRREDEGPGQVSARTEPVAGAPANPGANGGATAGGAPAVPAGASDILRKLMEQRAKEQ
jgi:hypothetical protein